MPNAGDWFDLLRIQTIDLEPYQYTGANITVFRIVDPSSEKMEAFLQYQEQQAEDEDVKPEDNQEIEENVCAPENEGEGYAQTQPELKWISLLFNLEESTSGILETHTALIYDGIMILAEAMKQLGAEQIKPQSIDCDDPSSVWPTGLTLTNFMKSVFCARPEWIRIQLNLHICFQSLHNGLTGDIEFDNHGLRSNISVDIMDLRWDGLNKIGNWKSEGNYRVNFTKVEAPPNESDKDYGPISNKTFRVIIALVK